MRPGKSRASVAVATATVGDRGVKRRREARHKQRNLTRCGSDTLSRQTPRKSPPGIFAAGHLRAEISSPEIRENWERRPVLVVCARICVSWFDARPRVRVKRRDTRDTSATVLAEEARDPGDRLIAARSSGRISVAATSRGENASHIRYPRYVYCGTFIARKPRRVIDKRVHLLSRLIKFGKGWVA